MKTWCPLQIYIILMSLPSVLWIRDVHPGSALFHPGSRIQGKSGSVTKNPGSKGQKAPVHGSGSTTLLTILSQFFSFSLTGLNSWSRELVLGVLCVLCQRDISCLGGKPRGFLAIATGTRKNVKHLLSRVCLLQCSGSVTFWYMDPGADPDPRIRTFD
jgi:hypothetical protein